MADHPYANLLATIRFCAERNGVAEVFLIPLRMLLSPVLIPLLPKRKFAFDGRELDYFHHRYNFTWANERAVEIPVARRYLAAAPGPDILEVGNVLAHYQPVAHEVLDKFEHRPGVLNEDIVTFQPARRYDLVLSVSTFEHIGYDDDEKDPSGRKILAAIANARRLLKPGGRFVLTASPGYNPAFDALVKGNRFGAARCLFLKRTNRLWWAECDEAAALGSAYNRPYSFGNAVVIAEFEPPA